MAEYVCTNGNTVSCFFLLVCFQFTKISYKQTLPSRWQHVAFNCCCLSTELHSATQSQSWEPQTSHAPFH